MSLQLLIKLNGDRRGGLFRWMESLEAAPRIAWYPSAGGDFRDLLFLHARLQCELEPAVPDLFLHTDYHWARENEDFSVGGILFDDGRTVVSIAEVEELPPLALPLDAGLVHFPEGSAWTGRVRFMRLLVNSTLLGAFERPVLYAFVENAAFIGRTARPVSATFTHVIQVRHGGGFGGGTSKGGWLRHTLTSLGCELFISDGQTDLHAADARIHHRYPKIWDPVPPLHLVRTVPSESWSNHGDVQWFVVDRGQQRRDMGPSSESSA
jgi:hypothetical protein